MDLYQLVYVSKSARKMHHYEVAEIVQQSSLANGKKGITGLLLYGGGNFLQVLEGKRYTIETLYKKVARDPRHKDVRQLLLTPATGRLFSRWQMGLLDLEAQANLDFDLLAAAGAADGNSLTLPLGTASTMNLIKEFRRQNSIPVAKSA